MDSRLDSLLYLFPQPIFKPNTYFLHFVLKPCSWQITWAKEFIMITCCMINSCSNISLSNISIRWLSYDDEATTSDTRGLQVSIHSYTDKGSLCKVHPKVYLAAGRSHWEALISVLVNHLCNTLILCNTYTFHVTHGNSTRTMSINITAVMML